MSTDDISINRTMVNCNRSSTDGAWGFNNRSGQRRRQAFSYYGRCSRYSTMTDNQRVDCIQVDSGGDD
ncbi:Uncharacterised protein [Yersinia enterocolitica]|nr:Uncharacterised protein [Yersinia enterocolitica]